MFKKLVLSAAVGSATLAMAQDHTESVYAPPSPVASNQGVNEGGVKFDVDVMYLTKSVYRGVDYTQAVDPATQDQGKSNTDMNLNAQMTFDLGAKMPHPFFALEANTYDSDPVSKFQEFRPTIGVDFTLAPLTFTAALRSYVYPKREDLETSEVDGQIAFDDGRLFGSDKPVFNPYVMAAYDYVVNGGWYYEAGIKHDFVFDDMHLTLTPTARIAYTMGWQQQFTFVQENGTGLQHWDVGLTASYSLNSLLNISKRWGDLYVRGYLFHTEHLAHTTVGQTVDWGGLGIGFQY